MYRKVPVVSPRDSQQIMYFTTSLLRLFFQLWIKPEQLGHLSPGQKYLLPRLNVRFQKPISCSIDDAMCLEQVQQQAILPMNITDCGNTIHPLKADTGES